MLKIENYCFRTLLRNFSLSHLRQEKYRYIIEGQDSKVIRLRKAQLRKILTSNTMVYDGFV